MVRQLRLTAASLDSPEQVERDATEHRQIAEALLAGRGRSARALLGDHIRAILPRIGLDATRLELPQPAHDVAAPTRRGPKAGAV